MYGAIAFYLANREANREMIDRYLQQGEVQFAQLQQSLRDKNRAFYQKLKQAGLWKFGFKLTQTLTGEEHEERSVPRSTWSGERREDVMS